MSTLVLERAARELIERACVRALPREACGALLARADDTELVVAAVEVVEVVELANLALATDEFTIDPGAVVALDTEARARGLVLAGFWHSHPAGPARPSERDRALAWDGYASLVAVPGPHAACEFAAFAKLRGVCQPLHVAFRAT